LLKLRLITPGNPITRIDGVDTDYEDWFNGWLSVDAKLWDDGDIFGSIWTQRSAFIDQTAGGRYSRAYDTDENERCELKGDGRVCTLPVSNQGCPIQVGRAQKHIFLY